MSNRSITHHVLTLAFALTTTSAALARRPPALLQLQEVADQASASCPTRPTEPGSGYRDMLTRLSSTGSPRLAASGTPATTVTRTVLACRIPEGHGYRDVLVRFSPESTEVEVASLGR